MKSSTKMWLGTACALALAAGCARERGSSQVQYEPMGSTSPAMGGETAAPPGGEVATTGRLSDAEVAKVLETVNRGEVQQAELALGKTQDPKVRDYAERMVEEHRRALERGRQVAQRMPEQPRTSQVDQQLTADTQRTLEELTRAEAGSFDHAYLGSQIEAHRKVLQLIDGVLLPSAQDPALRAEIEAVRPVISSHLQHAERLQSGS